MGAHRVGQETPVHRKLICFGLFREKVSFLIFLDKQYILSFTPRKLVSPMNSLSEMMIFWSTLITFESSSIFEVLKIGSSLKPNHHREI